MNERLEELKSRLKGSVTFMEELEIRDEILEIEKELGIAKTNDNGSSFECFGCGS